MAEYTPAPKSTGDQLTDVEWTSATNEIEEQETHDAAQDSDITALETSDAAQDTALSDIIGDIFNWKASNTRRLKRSLGAALGGQGYSDHLIIGDSMSSSYTGTPTTVGVDFAAMWSRRMQGLLAARNLPIGGTGWVFANDTGPSPVVNDDRWSFTGTWDSGYGYLSNTTAPATAIFTSDVPGTAIQFAYLDVNWMSPFTVKVDDGAPVTVTPSAVAGIVSVYQVTGLADKVHTVTISAAATNVFILAARCYRSSGIRIHNAAQQGARATTTWAEAAGFNTWTTRANAILTLLPNPDVVHLCLGANDIGNGASVATTVAALTNIRNHFATSDVILYAEPDTGFSGHGTTWPPFIAAMHTLSETLDCPLVDLYQRAGLYDTAVANGLVASDNIHPSKAFQGDLALLVTDRMLQN